MSPRAADPEVAEALIEVGARLIAEKEPLSTRRLASELGTSTSAVYTHFGSMADLRRAIRRAGFERLADYQTRFERGDDPVTDLVKQGWAYCQNALTNPNMYRVMFMEAPVDESDAGVGLYTFEMLVEGVQRCIDGGRFEDRDAGEMALQLWSSTHGIVTLYLAGMLDEEQVDRLTLELGSALFAWFGDDPDRTKASFSRAREWTEAQTDRTGE